MTQKNLSAFGETAVSLDQGFTDLQELGGQLERLSLASESDFERARAILVKFAACGQSVAEGLQTLAATLGETRARAEATAARVSERAVEIQARQKDTDRLLSRFGELGESVKRLTAEIAELQKGSSIDHAKLIENLPQFESKLAALSGDAHQLKEEAHGARMKGLEKNADSLAQALNAMRGRLSGLRAEPALH